MCSLCNVRIRNVTEVELNDVAYSAEVP